VGAFPLPLGLYLAYNLVSSLRKRNKYANGMEGNDEEKIVTKVRKITHWTIWMHVEVGKMRGGLGQSVGVRHLHFMDTCGRFVTKPPDTAEGFN